MTIKIIRDVRLSHEGREFIQSPGQVLEANHPLAARFVELLNSGAAEPVPAEVEAASVQPTEKAVKRGSRKP